MPQINSYCVTLARLDGQLSTMLVLALNLVDAQEHAERLLTAGTDYSSVTVERVRP